MPDATPAPNGAAKPSAAPAEPLATEGADTPDAEARNGAEGGGSQDASGAKDAKPAPEEYEITIDGQTHKVTRDQLIRMAQKAAGADSRFRQGTESQRKGEALLKELTEDPIGVLLKLGKSADDIEKSLGPWAEARAKEAALSDDEKARLKLERERDAYKKQADTAAEEKKQAAQRTLDERNAQRLEQTLLQAADKAGLPVDAHTSDALAKQALEWLDMGLEFTAEQLVAEVKWSLEHADEKASNGYRSKLEKLEGEALLKELGDALLKRVQDATKKRLPFPGNGNGAPKGKPKAAPTPARGYTTEVEFNKKWGI